MDLSPAEPNPSPGSDLTHMHAPLFCLYESRLVRSIFSPGFKGLEFPGAGAYFDEMTFLCWCGGQLPPYGLACLGKSFHSRSLWRVLWRRISPIKQSLAIGASVRPLFMQESSFRPGNSPGVPPILSYCGSPEVQARACLLQQLSLVKIRRSCSLDVLRRSSLFPPPSATFAHSTMQNR